MSQIYMCDNCGDIFSVNVAGWEEYTKKGVGTGYNNPNNHGAMTMHIGPCCSGGGVGIVKPRIAIANKMEDKPNDI